MVGPHQTRKKRWCRKTKRPEWRGSSEVQPDLGGPVDLQTGLRLFLVFSILVGRREIAARGEQTTRTDVYVLGRGEGSTWAVSTPNSGKVGGGHPGRSSGGEDMVGTRS